MHPRRAKDSKTIGFGGVLWVLSAAVGRKCPAGGNNRGMRIATASVRTGFAMTPFARSTVQVRDGGVWAPRSTGAWQGVRCKTGQAGKSAKRRRWRMKRAGFEEVPADWRLRQWPPIGWHDSGQENPAHSHNISPFATGDRKGRPYGCMSPKIFVGAGYSSG